MLDIARTQQLVRWRTCFLCMKYIDHHQQVKEGVHVPSSVARELMSRHFGLHKARLVEATVTYIHTGKTGKKTRHGYCGFQMEFPACVG